MGNTKIDTGAAKSQIALRGAFLQLPAVRPAVTLLACLIGALDLPAQQPVDIGPLQLTVHQGRTAQLFHIVDQLAEWDPRTHKSYVRWAHDSLRLEAADSAALSRHAALRRVRGWNSGFEDTFYTDLNVAAASRRATAEGTIGAGPAAREAEILARFEGKLAPMLDSGSARLLAFAARIPAARDTITRVMAPMVKLTGVTQPVLVPIYLVANPMKGSRGGRFVARRVIVEVPESPDPIFSLYHELTHVLLAPHERAIRALASHHGLSFDDLNEGLAYAFSPGLTDHSDPLTHQAALNRNGNRAIDVAMSLRPALRDAIEQDQSFDVFLRHAGEALRFSSLFRTSR